MAHAHAAELKAGFAAGEKRESYEENEMTETNRG